MERRNEKSSLAVLTRQDYRACKHGPNNCVKIIVVLLGCVCLMTLNWLYQSCDAQPNWGPPLNVTTKRQRLFDWESIIPSQDLKYVPCNGRYQCARLLLPIDWTSSSEQQWANTVAVAVMKLPANISAITDPRYGGEIYVNPGGPGASGVNFLMRRGDYLDRIVNTESKVFDIVGFDPRGVAHSTPRFSCFGPGNVQGRELFALTEGSYGWSDDALPKIWARAEAFTKMCESTNVTAEQMMLKSHMSTASVARDLVEIVERAGKLRATTLQEVLAYQKPGKDFISAERTEMLKYRPGQEKLQYWGFSYGTHIGGHFASMFPDKVGRMVLDGNGNYTDWVSGRWMSFLKNTDASFQSLFSACFAAGKDRCALFHPDGAQAIKDGVLSTLAELKANPISVWEEGMIYPEILTYEKVIGDIFMATYVPYGKFPPLATALAAMKDRHIMNMSAIREFIPNQEIRCSDRTCVSEDCAEEDGAWYHESNVAVSCSDTAAAQQNRTFADFKEWVSNLRNQSNFFGGFFASDSTMACHEWPMPPKYRFNGPFEGRTNHPILFVGNTVDPVAPMENSIEMASAFEGSVVLSTNATGHCSPAAPSQCTAMHIRKYFQLGQLPKPGSICQTDYPLFGEPPLDSQAGDKKHSMSRALKVVAESDGLAVSRFTIRLRLKGLSSLV